MSEWSIETGDCLDVMSRLEPASVNLEFADPPYNQGIAYDGHNDRMTAEGYQAWCQEWITPADATLAPDGTMFLVNSWEWADQSGRLLKAAGLHVRQWVIWYETSAVNCTTKYNRTSRPLLWCVRDPKRFTFNRESVTRPSDRLTKYHDKRANPAGKVWDDVWKIPRLAGTHKERSRVSRRSFPSTCCVRSWGHTRTLATWYSIRSQVPERPGRHVLSWGVGFLE
jgi:hypothetical protein